MDRLFSGENDFLDILIYLVFIIGGLAANAYRNYVKRKEEQNRQTETPDEEAEFPDLFPETIFGEREPKPIMTEEEMEEENEYDVQEEFIVPEEPEAEITVESSGDRSVIEGNAVFESTNSQLLSDDMHNLGQSISDEIAMMGSSLEETPEEEKEEFDLKRAVIYSEILNRKYD